MEKLKIQYMRPENLIPYVNNNKYHSDDQVLRLASSIQEFGFDQALVVDKNNVIIKGHARHQAALKLKLKEVPVIVADHLNELQVKASRIADNKSSSNEYNHDALKFELGYLDSQNFNINLTAIQEVELNNLMKNNTVNDDFQKSIIGELINKGPNPTNPIAEVVKEISNTSKELDLNDFNNFDHQCPKCGFEWDKNE